MIAVDTMPVPRFTPDFRERPREKPEPLFHSADAAVRFAFSLEGAPKRPGMAARIKSVGEGLRRSLGFEGLDAAAQAGMITGTLRTGLDPNAYAALVARCASRTDTCHCRRACCSGRTVNRAWHDAIDTLQWAARKALPPRSHSTQFMRQAILVRIYGDKEMKLQTIADDNCVDLETARRHHNLIHAWLLGKPAKGKDMAVVGIEPAAWAKAEALLWEAGIVGEVQ